MVAAVHAAAGDPSTVIYVDSATVERAAEFAAEWLRETARQNAVA